VARTVAVEDSLTPIRQYLQEKGYEVVSLRPGHKADAAVISGGDKDVMGIQTVAQDVPVIDARGMRPEEVLQALEGKWQ
jgi:predicted CoA-binding protein